MFALKRQVSKKLMLRRGKRIPIRVGNPLHIIILKYDYMNDYMYDYMKGVTNSLWEFVSPASVGGVKHENLVY